jgi:hypothetical protein
VRKTWRVRTRSHGPITVVRWLDLLEGEEVVAVPVRETDIVAWLNDPITSRPTVDMHKAVRPAHTGRVNSATQRFMPHLVRELTDAFRQRELVALRQRERLSLTPSVLVPEEPTQAPPAEVEKKTKTWIAIALVNDDGEPVPDMPYRLKLPDGAIREGRLDSRGRARVDGIDPGMCEVTFQELDGREWGPA